MDNDLIAYCGVDCSFCPDMKAFYEESEGHKQAYERMLRERNAQ